MILTEPLNIRSLKLRNRLVLPPMATEKSLNGGIVGQALCDYYDEKTQGGYFGLVITEHSYISMEGKASPSQISLSKDEDIEGLRRLVDVLHRNGSKVFAQINHAGGKAIIALDQKTTSLAPTEMHYVSSRGEELWSHTMNQEEINKVIEDFAAGARRVKDAGYDGVEIHSAHGYLLNQFYSPLTNKRTDEYAGNTIEGRTLLHRQVIEAVRKEVGPDFPVAIRFGACDYQEGGSTIDDAVMAAKLFMEAGIDLIDVSGGLCGYRGTGSNNAGYFGAESQAIKEAVPVPVILTGGVRDGASAEDLLEAGKADLIGVGRAVLKDSLWAKKAFEELGVFWTA